MRLKIFFAWYDFWIGAYWDVKKRTLYVCLFPCIVVSVECRAQQSAELDASVNKQIMPCKHVFTHPSMVVVCTKCRERFDTIVGTA